MGGNGLPPSEKSFSECPRIAFQRRSGILTPALEALCIFDKPDQQQMKQRKRSRISALAQKRLNKKEAIPYTKEIAEAVLNPYTDELLRLIDRFNLEEAFSILLTAVIEIEKDYDYTVAIRRLHTGLQSLAENLGFSDQTLEQIMEHEPGGAFMIDNGKKRMVHSYRFDPLDFFAMIHRFREAPKAEAAG
jgi:hypothetical protein